MRSIKFQYFLLFGSFAAVQPYLPLLLRERGLDDLQLGYVMGAAGWAIMLSPIVVTLLADTGMQPRRLMAVCYGVAGAALFALMASSHSAWSLLTSYFVYSLATTAMVPLQDGVMFGYQKAQQEAGLPTPGYEAARVWGTYGYIAVLIGIFLPMQLGGGLSVAMAGGVLCIGLGLANAYALPDRGRRETAKRARALPTAAAMKVLFGRENLHFSLGMFLLLACSAGYHTMYPLFLTENLGLGESYVGIVIMSGALVEIFYIFWLGRWQRRWGLRALMLAGVAATVLRFALMYGAPNLSMAIGTQLLHGAMICAMMVIPPMYINRFADESNRHSAQGVYTVMIVGTSRFAGTALSGHVAAWGMREVFLMCAVLAAAALLLMWRGFRPRAA